jgi:catechol 2,3-dioxygenase-like lactoylglutathione lyase family enzyme
MIRLRSIELALPRADDARDFLTGKWGLELAQSRSGTPETHYLRGSGSFAYLVSLTEADAPSVRSTTFVVAPEELAHIRVSSMAQGLRVVETASADPGGGEGVYVVLPEGEVFRFLIGVEEIEPLEGRDMPVKLTHVVMNSADAEATADMAEKALGFKVSDRTKGMVFVRCSNAHHSVAFARAGYASLNHIAFEMKDMDAVMRGIGRMRDHGVAPAWGPGRHGPGDNVYAYYISPFGAVVEYSTAVEEVPDDYRVGAPEDWTWPPNRIDQWGISDKDFEALGRAERVFAYASLEEKV